MSSSVRRFVRPVGVFAAAAVVMLTLSSGAALADPGNGKGKGQADKTAAAPAMAGGSTSADSSSSSGGSDQASASSATSSNSSSSKSKGNSSKAKASSSSKSTGNSSKSNGSKTSSSHKTSGTAGTSGDPTKPQPNSNADNNPGGANGQCPGGPYCSTRDGSPSLNGNGNGKATGKPCAGCVGKADNKNPKGQKPNGSDHNAGYECDRNHGIGRSNPAHTGCVSTPPSDDCTSHPNKPECQPDNCTTHPNKPECQPEDCTTNPDKPECQPEDCTTNPDQEGCQPEECVPTEAVPCTPTTNRPPVVKGIEVFRTPPTVKAAEAARPAAAALPNTGAGASSELLGLVGLSLLATGVVTMRLRRRQQV